MKQKQDFTDKIKKISDILELGIPKISNKNLQMLCPFHEEYNASFGINIDKGIYHCFACAESGHINTLSDNLRGHIVPQKIKNISHYKVKTYIDNVSYNSKPNREEFGKITNRVRDYSQNFKEYNINELAYYLLHGHTVAPAGIKNQEEWKEQQLVMIDFDNKDETNFTREQVLEFAERINLIPTFCYYTFNHLNNELQKNKFRFVYCFTEPIRDKKKMESIIRYIHNRFKEFKPDLSCIDISKKFMGTNNEDIYGSDCIYKPSNRFTEEQLEEVETIIGIMKSKQQKRKYKSITVKELMQKNLPNPRIIVEKTLYQGVTILAGCPKKGKSWNCLYLGYSVSTGTNFLGFKSEKCDVLYLALEDSENRLQFRLKKVLGENEMPDGFHLLTNFSTLDNGFLEDLEEELLDHPNIGLIIIDTFQKIRSPLSKSSDGGYGKDYIDVSNLKKFADSHKLSILIIHHFRKQKDEDIFNQISGSTGLIGAADTIIAVDNVKDSENNLKFYITGRDIESQEMTLKISDKETCKWEVLYSEFDNVETRTEEMLYNGNPIVISIKKMLSINPDGYKTTSSDLIKTVKQLTGTYPNQKVNTLTKYIKNDLQFKLMKYDGISYTPPNEDGGSAGRTMFFCKPKIEEKTEDNK